MLKQFLAVLVTAAMLASAASNDVWRKVPDFEGETIY